MNYHASEIKRIGRKARRFQVRHKFPRSKFKIDLGDHPGVSLITANSGIFQSSKKSIHHENL